MKITTYYDIGQERSGQEDSFLCDEENKFFAVCDGMGGHQGGEVASSMVRDHLKTNQDQILNLEELCRVVEDSNDLLLSEAEKLQLRGMGTTCVALQIADDEGWVAHVGDSRLYVWDREGVHQVTKDQTEAQRLVDEGHLEPERYTNHYLSCILRQVLGQQKRPKAEKHLLDLSQIRKILICSDGMSDYFEITEMEEKLPVWDAEDFGREANARGGKDNITVIVLDF